MKRRLFSYIKSVLDSIPFKKNLLDFVVIVYYKNIPVNNFLMISDKSLKHPSRQEVELKIIIKIYTLNVKRKTFFNFTNNLHAKYI